MCLLIISVYNIDFLLVFILLIIVNVGNGEFVNGGLMKVVGVFNIVIKLKFVVSWFNFR